VFSLLVLPYSTTIQIPENSSKTSGWNVGIADGTSIHRLVDTLHIFIYNDCRLIER